MLHTHVGPPSHGSVEATLTRGVYVQIVWTYQNQGIHLDNRPEGTGNTFLPKQIPCLCKLSWRINPFLILILSVCVCLKV